jgi:anionic cell wall polymer biosynthesis LytR-Cps2A-Psr (LCP) family protein
LEARTLLDNFGMRVDHYVAVDLQTFVKVVDAIGGVDVFLPKDVYGTINGETMYQYFPAGEHHLNGEQALALARNRIPTTFQRAKYQDIILRALLDKTLTPSVLPKLPQLINALKGSTLTDLSPDVISKLVCLAPKITNNNFVSVTFPEEWFKPSDIFDQYRNVNTFIYEVDFDLIRSYVANFMNGTWPAP